MHETAAGLGEVSEACHLRQQRFRAQGAAEALRKNLRQSHLLP